MSKTLFKENFIFFRYKSFPTKDYGFRDIYVKHEININDSHFTNQDFRFVVQEGILYKYKQIWE